MTLLHPSMRDEFVVVPHPAAHQIYYQGVRVATIIDADAALELVARANAYTSELQRLAEHAASVGEM